MIQNKQNCLKNIVSTALFENNIFIQPSLANTNTSLGF